MEGPVLSVEGALLHLSIQPSDVSTLGIGSTFRPYKHERYDMQSYHVDEDHNLQPWSLCYSSYPPLTNLYLIRAQSTYICFANTLLRDHCCRHLDLDIFIRFNS
jgi:hypothetical protein